MRSFAVPKDTSVRRQKKRERTPSTTRNLPTRISSTEISGCNLTSNPPVREPSITEPNGCPQFMLILLLIRCQLSLVRCQGTGNRGKDDY